MANKKSSEENSSKNWFNNFDNIFSKKKTVETNESKERKKSVNNYKNNFDAIFAKKKDKVKPDPMPLADKHGMGFLGTLVP